MSLIASKNCSAEITALGRMCFERDGRDSLKRSTTLGGKRAVLTA